jgi:hypothetical protein
MNIKKKYIKPSSRQISMSSIYYPVIEETKQCVTVETENIQVVLLGGKWHVVT